jgi:hypothetical protein
MEVTLPKRKIKVTRKRRLPTSFVLETEHVEFLRRTAKESAARIGKPVNISHIVRALIRRAMDEEQEKGRIWNDDIL